MHILALTKIDLFANGHYGETSFHMSFVDIKMKICIGSKKNGTSVLGRRDSLFFVAPHDLRKKL
jgi:hypothetical protein